MLVFWKKNEKEEREVRRREQKEAVDRAKVEEEKREAARQARKLEFLISQTELYSHFVGNKLKSMPLVCSRSRKVSDTPYSCRVGGRRCRCSGSRWCYFRGERERCAARYRLRRWLVKLVHTSLESVCSQSHVDDESNMQRHARHNAQAAIAMAKKKAQEFDTQASLERKTNEALKLAKRQAHIHAEETVEGSSTGTPLVDRTSKLLSGIR